MSLIVSHLHKKYGDKTVVEDLSFEMAHPGVYALLGTNGAGKTTSIRMMLNMLAKNGGEVLWNGKNLSIDTCNVGYLAEERGLYPKCPLMDQLIYFASLRGISRNDAKQRIRTWAERLEVEEYFYPTGTAKGGAGAFGKRVKPRIAESLSKGNQQKIQFLAAFITEPELIILDEPMSGLDPVNTDIIRDVIRSEIDSGKYIIMSSHQMATVEEFCTDITIMHRSRSVLSGNLNAIKKAKGRTNLHLKTEGDADFAIQAVGAEKIAEKDGEYQIRVTGDSQANELLSRLIAAGITVVTFDLSEPSLHEIFVETVGEPHEA